MRLLLVVLLVLVVSSCSNTREKNIVWYDQQGVVHSVDKNVAQDREYLGEMEQPESVQSASTTAPSSERASENSFSGYIDSGLLEEQGFQLTPSESFYTWIDETGYVRNAAMPGAPDVVPVTRQTTNLWSLAAIEEEKLCCEVIKPAKRMEVFEARSRKLLHRDITGLLKKNGEEMRYSLYKIKQGAANNSWLSLRCYEERRGAENYCQAPELLIVNDSMGTVYQLPEMKINFFKASWKQRAYYEIALNIPVEDGLILLSAVSREEAGGADWFIQKMRDE